MKLNLIILACIVLAGLGAASYIGFSNQAGSSTQLTMPILPAFSFTTLNQKKYGSSDFAGKTVLVNFWASWCAPCVAEFPKLLQLAKKYPDKLVLIAVSSDYDSQAITHFIKALSTENQAILKQKNVLTVYDENSKITFDLFQTSKLPETIIVDRQQHMVDRLIGAEWDPKDIEKYIVP